MLQGGMCPLCIAKLMLCILLAWEKGVWGQQIPADVRPRGHEHHRALNFTGQTWLSWELISGRSFLLTVRSFYLRLVFVAHGKWAWSLLEI